MSTISIPGREDLPAIDTDYSAEEICELCGMDVSNPERCVGCEYYDDSWDVEPGVEFFREQKEDKSEQE